MPIPNPIATKHIKQIAFTRDTTSHGRIEKYLYNNDSFFGLVTSYFKFIKKF